MATSSASLPDLPNKPGVSNWVEKAGGLPKLIERAAKHLHSEKGYPLSRAIATAVNWAKKMCASGTAFGGKVKVGAKAQAAACKAVQAWNAKRGKAKLSETLGLVETLADEEFAELTEAMALLETVAVDEQAWRDMADFPLVEVVTELEDGEPAACALELLVEAATPMPTSHAKRRPGESLGQYGKRLKRGDSAIRRAAKTRSGEAKDADFESKHPRGRGGSWVLKAGAKGDDVRRVQRTVGAAADGQYGPKTAAAVRRFQRARGLKVDGIVGAQTIAEMRKKGAGKKVAPGKASGSVPRPAKKHHPGRGRLPGALLESTIPEDGIGTFTAESPG